MKIHARSLRFRNLRMLKICVSILAEKTDNVVAIDLDDGTHRRLFRPSPRARRPGGAIHVRQHYFLNPCPHFGKTVMILGGGNIAIVVG